MIREYTYSDLDLANTANVWLRSGLAEYHYLDAFQRLNETKALDVFRRIIHDTCKIWVYETDQNIVGFMAMDGNLIDRLYVDPDSQGAGVGSQFIDFAKELYQEGLRLKTHQQNTKACAFYEKRGFVVAAYGTSPPPESMPDVEYHWGMATD